MKCICGTTIDGEGRPALVRSAHEHIEAAHAELGLNDGQIEDFVDAGLRARRWDGSRRELPAQVEVHPLSVERVQDFLEFFDHDGFADNPAWGSCYCMAQHFDGPNEAWVKQRAAENRRLITQRIQGGTTSGVLAYAEGRVVGWCNAGPRAHRLGLRRYPGVVEGPDDGVGSIVCYVVAPWYRGQGLPRRLLDAALDLMRSQNLTVAEAYPFPKGGPFGIDFVGTEKMYREAGFEEVRQAGPALVMRQTL